MPAGTCLDSQGDAELCPEEHGDEIPSHICSLSDKTMEILPKGYGWSACRRASSDDMYTFQKEIADVIKNDKKEIITTIQDEFIVIAESQALRRGCAWKEYVHFTRIRVHIQRPWCSG